MARVSDPDEHPVRAFWHALDALRRERGLSYKQLERRTRIASSTSQYWMTRSMRLVAWSQVRPLVIAMGAKEEVWLDRWKQTDHELTAQGRRDRTVAARAQLPMDIREFTGRG